MKNADNMTWLVWKEYRQNRLIVLLALFLLILPYLACPVMVFISWRWKWPPHITVPYWIFWPGMATWASLLISQLTLALIGGNAIAAEQVDRSAEFQDSLPIERTRIVTAKLLLVLLMFAVIWLPNAAALGSLLSRMYSPRLTDYQPVFAILANIAITGLTFFCVAWLFSSLLRSPAIAVCMGVMTPFVVWSLPWLYTYLHHIPIDDVVPLIELWYRVICLTLSPICLAAGTWHFLRRVEP